MLILLLASCNKQELEPLTSSSMNPLDTLNNVEWYFKKVPLNSPNASICLLGDSMFKYTDVGNPPSDLESWNSLLGGTNVTNLGLTGARIRNLWDFGSPTYLQQALDLNPDIIYVSIGANNRPDADSVIRDEYITLGQSLEASGIPFVFSVIYPCTYGYTETFNNGFNTRSNTIAEILIEVCEEYGWDYVDMRKQLIYKRPQDGLWYIREDYSIDGIHLNNKGYTEWCKAFTRDINERI